MSQLDLKSVLSPLGSYDLSTCRTVFQESEGRTLLSTQQRQKRIASEQRKAALTRQRHERNRPKFVMQGYEYVKQTPAYYIQKARNNFLCRTASSSNFSTKLMSTDMSRVSREPTYVKPERFRQSPEANLRKVYPDWLTARPDFNAALKSFQEAANNELARAINVAPSQRSQKQKDALFSWIKPVFEQLPEELIGELCERVKLREMDPGDCLDPQPIDAMFILYSGNVYTNTDCLCSKSILSDPLKNEFTPFIAENAVKLLELTRNDLENVQLNLKKIEKMENCQVLKQNEYFSAWNEFKLQRLSTILKIHQYSAGQVIYKVDQESDAFYIVKSGQVEVQAYVEVKHENHWPTGPHNWKTHQVHRKYVIALAQVCRAQYFGEIDLLQNTPRTTRAIAIEDTVCLVLSKADFVGMFTTKDLNRLKEVRAIFLPSEAELARRVLKHIEERSSKEQALLDAMKVDYRNSDGRDFLLDSRGKKLKKWVTHIKGQKEEAARCFRRQIVKERVNFLTINSTQEKNELKT